MSACVICQRREPYRPMVCDGCRLWLPGVLREIVEGYAVLGIVDLAADERTAVRTEWATVDGHKVRTPVLDAQGGPIMMASDPVAGGLPAGTVRNGSRGAPVTGSREAPAPVSLDAVDLAGQARQGSRAPHARGVLGDADQVGHLAVATELELWVIDWIGARQRAEHRPEPTVVTLAGWLTVRIEWACDEHDAVDEFAADLRRMRAAIRQANQEGGDRIHIGNCPTLLDDRPCDTRLSADPYVDRIRCPRCRTEWPRERWLWLGSVLRDEAA